MPNLLQLEFMYVLVCKCAYQCGSLGAFKHGNVCAKRVHMYLYTYFLPLYVDCVNLSAYAVCSLCMHA